MSRWKLSPPDIYELLPKTNCKECGEQNCLTFAARLVNREVTLEKCLPLLTKEHEEAYVKLKETLKPAIREFVVGVGDQSVKIGGKLAMYRHEFSYSNPTAIAIDVTDGMSDEEILKRVEKTLGFNFQYIGQTLKLDMIAVRSTSDNPDKFKAAVKKVVENANLPLILCSLQPNVLEAGLMAAPSRPLLYAATKNNWREVAELALTHNCPLTVSASGNLKLLKSLTKTLLECGVQDLVLDPGTFPSLGLAETLNNFTMIRRAACKKGDELCGFPLLGVPMMAWVEKGEALDEIAMWREACLAAMLIVRYADVLILHTVDGWSLLPNVVLRQNIYADPREPVAAGLGSKVIGACAETKKSSKST